MPQIDRSIQSPNWSDHTRAVDMLIIHATAGRFASDIEELTDNTRPLALRKSVTYYITKAGKIYQLVDEDKQAWHAGVSRWGNRNNLNNGSIGIELENLNTGRDPYPQEQVNALIDLSIDIMSRRGITEENVLRHLDVSPGRKSDPAGFDWAGYKSVIDGNFGWKQWGTKYPLPPEQRQWGIAATWYPKREQLGRAVAPVVYVDIGMGNKKGVVQYFEHGAVIGSDHTGMFRYVLLDK